MRWFAVLFAALVLAAPAAALKPLPNRFVVVTNGHAKELFSDYYRRQAPCWTADGKAILALRSNHQKPYVLQRIDPVTGARTNVLKVKSNSSPPVLAANCTEIATDTFTSNHMDNQLAVDNIDGSQRAAIDFPGHRWLSVESMELSPDGAHLAVVVASGYGRPYSGLWLFDAHTGALEHHLYVKTTVYLNDQAWSTDSARLLFSEPQHPGLRTYDVATGRQTLVAKIKSGRYVTNVGFLPDGGAGAVGLDDLQRDHSIAEYPGGARTVALPFPIQTFIPFQNRLLVGTAPKSRKGTVIASVPAPGKPGKAKDVVNVGPGIVHDVVPSPDGTRLLVVLGFERYFIG